MASEKMASFLGQGVARFEELFTERGRTPKGELHVKKGNPPTDPQELFTERGRILEEELNPPTHPLFELRKLKKNKNEEPDTGSIFEQSGPVHLKEMNWQSIDDRRIVAASGCQGAYVLEYDREEKREGVDALAPPWWCFFGYALFNVLIDPKDSTIFGAIYEFDPTASNYYQVVQGIIPRFVIVFRGTIINKHCGARDSWLDFGIGMEELHKSARFKVAEEAVQLVVSIVRAEFGTALLAGHSMGSSIAMLVGRKMAKSGIYLETYLFNNPFVSIPIEKIIKNDKVRHGVHCVTSVVKAGAIVVIKGIKHHQFTTLSKWTPDICVNPGDYVCSIYMDYFKGREKMENSGLGRIERLASQASLTELLKKAVGRRSEVIDLIPSARMTVNHSPSQTLRQAHGIKQWFTADQNLQSEVYCYGY